jgi:hypothetical protein
MPVDTNKEYRAHNVIIDLIGFYQLKPGSFIESPLQHVVVSAPINPVIQARVTCPRPYFARADCAQPLPFQTLGTERSTFIVCAMFSVILMSAASRPACRLVIRTSAASDLRAKMDCPNITAPIVACVSGKQWALWYPPSPRSRQSVLPRP